MAFDVPIQRGNLFLDKLVVTKKIIKISVNGKCMRIDVLCKKLKIMPDIEFRNCKKYDIKLEEF